jgi:uncharacterized protein (TIGR03083 family)
VRLSRAERERVFVAVADERRSIATLIDGLNRDQLATESLCAGWDVKTVAAHLVSDFADGFWGFVVSGIRHGSIDRGVDALARRRARASAAEIAETLRRRADHGLSPLVTGPLSGLTDVLVHGADMRIPLGLPHRPDPQHVARVLDFLTSPTQLGFFPRRRLRGIALHDEDTGRTWGDGESIRGSGVAVMLAVCGRTVALDRLAGQGCPCCSPGLLGRGGQLRPASPFESGQARLSLQRCCDVDFRSEGLMNRATFGDVEQPLPLSVVEVTG